VTVKRCASCGVLVPLEVELCPRCGDVADERPAWTRSPLPAAAGGELLQRGDYLIDLHELGG
jgi:hypothetical protein